MQNSAREAWEVVKLGWVYAVGVAFGVVAVVEAVKGSHDSGWFWGFWAMTALFHATGWRLVKATRARDRLETEIADEHGSLATARRLEVLANEGERLREDMPGADADAAEWQRAVVGAGLEGIVKHWAFQVESELRRNAPEYLSRWNENPPDIPLGQGWLTAAYARRMVEYAAGNARGFANELRTQ
jgi:hypothetical protein